MKELLKSLSDFQAECPPFVKNIQGYGYTYTGLPELVQTVYPLLKKHGLVLVQKNAFTDDKVGVESTVYHIETGESLTSSLLMPIAELKGMNVYQSAGSAITYIRRYDMSTLLGLQSEKDTDATSGKQPTKKKTPAKKTPPKKVKVEIGTDKFNILVKWLNGGGDIQKIKDKYDVSDEVIEELKKQSSVKPETKEGKVANG